MNRKLLLISTACAILAAGSSTAFAQTQSLAEERETNVGELVITAQKREERLQDVPVAVSAFSSETRDLLGVTSIFDLTNNVPGLAYSVGLDRTFVRGIGRNTNAPGTDPGVAVYVDGVYSASTVPAGRSSLFGERVEVLRGPQGTLYGRNSMGGAINMVSSRPGDTFTGEARASYGNLDNKSLSLRLDGPITDWLRFQIGGIVVEQDEGFYHNVAGGPDEGGPNSEKYYTGMLDFNFGEKIDGFVRAETYSYDRANRGLTQNTVFRSPYETTTRRGGLTINPYYGFTGVNPAIADPFAFAADTTNHTFDHDTWNTQANVTWHGEGFDVKYIGGYSQYVYSSTFDGDGSARGAWSYQPAPFDIGPYVPPAFGGPFAPGLVFQPQPAVTLYPTIGNYLENKKFSSHEIDFASTGDGPVQWIGGLYYYQENFLNTYRTWSPLQTELGAIAGNADRNYVLKPSLNEGKSYAAFGQVDWKFAPQWKATFGLRYNKDEKSGTENLKYYYFFPTVATGGSYSPAAGPLGAFNAGNASPAATCPATLLPGTTCRVDATTNTRYTSGEWDDYSGTLGVEYKPNDETLLYAKYSRGFKAGGINMSVGALSPEPFTKPETLNAYEVGYKFQAGRQLTLNTAAYFYDFRNYQDFDGVPNPATGALTAVGVNIDKSEIYGLDVEANWHPTSQFTLLGNYSYIHARVKEEAGGFVDTLDPTATGPGATPNAPLICIPAPATAPPGTPCTPQRAQSIVGATLKGSPENKIGVTALYRFDFEPGSLSLSATYNWRTGVYSSFFDRAYYKSPSYSSTNLRAVWNGAGKKYTVIAFVNNVENEIGYEYVTAALNSAGGPALNQTLTIPRTYGIEIQRKF